MSARKVCRCGCGTPLPARKDEWAFKYSFLALVAGLTLAVCTAEYGDGLRYAVQQYLIHIWSNV
jgi:hypothetical protein